jgi:predicted permease
MGRMSTRRLRSSWWPRRRPQTDFSAEIQAHVDLEVARLTADGLGLDEARQQARRAFGNMLAAEERYYESGRWIWLDQFRQDLRYAARSLRHSPSSSATIVGTLALGLGLVTALFTAFDVYVLRPLAIHDPYQVYDIRWRSPGGGGYQFSVRQFEELRGRHDIFVDAVASRQRMMSSGDRSVHVAFVSGNYFDMLQPRVALGRALAPFDARTPDSAPVAVLSDYGWARLFDRDPRVLGRRVPVNGQSLEIIGVMGPEFAGMDDLPRDLWTPLTMYRTLGGEDLYAASQPQRVTVFARLRHDVTAAQAIRALTPYMDAVDAHANPDRGSQPGTARAVMEVRSSLNPPTLETVATLSPVVAAFVLVLLVACANVSNVLLARALDRHREIGIRLAIGAGRGRIIRQLLTEALLMSAPAGLAGLAFAFFTLGAAKRLLYATLPASMIDLFTVQPMEVNYRVFLFALGAAAFTTLIFALLPALQATRLSLTAALRGLPAPGLRSGRMRDLLVACQVTVSLVLLIAAATFARNGAAIATMELGLNLEGVVSVNQRTEGDSLIRPAAEALLADPRIVSVAITNRNPLFGRFPNTAVQVPERAETTPTAYMFVSPEYFPLLGIPIVRGRTFQANEAHDEARVGIVSARAAARLWPGRDPIGQRLRIVPDDRSADILDAYPDIVVVGVARDVVSGMVYDGVDPAMLYLPTSAAGTRAGALLVRGRDAGELRRGGIGAILERVHPDRQVFETLALTDMAAIMLYPLRAASWLGAMLGFVALGLSASGLYGVLMYVLGRRTREIGIRMALGATAHGVVALIMRQSARVVGAGAAVGLLFAFVVLKLLSTVVPLDQVTFLDGWSFAIALALIALAGGLATWMPARRASRVDPAHTLRADA